MKKYVVAITGASGIVYGMTLMIFLAKAYNVDLIISESAFSVMSHELSPELKDIESVKLKTKDLDVRVYSERDFYAPIASGSNKIDGMFIVPCSMKTLSAIASGFADNLITRAADVMIKEGRKLIVSPREMPFSSIHLENMLKLSRLGVVIAPPVPAFYHNPQGLEDMINFVVGKLLDLMGIENDLYRRWNG
ncbi:MULTISPECIES: UbiX family flavin prenyltransferase [Thermodesulfovibrio]|jgi:4-hydroxy-3-polyprenylbenzoate decarboxylase|uniref:UbiX family flavin prenyltransferase n=1 Tax=Thermodesulfovibrio TaxID=28261 RepID=UPI0026101C7B|nr:flavin prenyltransferase UbiX [Thermodesulfovibrio sp.]